MHISEITSERGGHGGKFIEDVFEITSADLVDVLMEGHAPTGALCLRANATAVMLAAPLEFKFKARRGERTSQLLVTGHFMCLVDRDEEMGGPHWSFDDERMDYAEENKLAYKKAVARIAHAMDTFPAHLLEFLEVLL